MLAHAEKHGHNITELLRVDGGEFDNKNVLEILPKKGVMQKIISEWCYFIRGWVKILESAIFVLLVLSPTYMFLCRRDVRKIKKFENVIK